MTNSVLAYLALGSNLGDPVAQLVEARAAIGQISGVKIVAASSLYESPAWGSDVPQPDYVNAVVAVQTGLSAQALWLATTGIEKAQGRVRNFARNGARTLDIDLLLYNHQRIDSKALTLPHPRMHERSFVLIPLLEIAPDIVIEGRGSASDCFNRLAPSTIRRLTGNSLWN